LQEVLWDYAGWIWDEHDGRIKALSWYSNQSMQRLSLCSLIQVHKGAYEEVQSGGLQTNGYTNTFQLKNEQRRIKQQGTEVW